MPKVTICPTCGAIMRNASCEACGFRPDGVSVEQARRASFITSLVLIALAFLCWPGHEILIRVLDGIGLFGPHPPELARSDIAYTLSNETWILNAAAPLLSFMAFVFALGGRNRRVGGTQDEFATVIAATGCLYTFVLVVFGAFTLLGPMALGGIT